MDIAELGIYLYKFQYLNQNWYVALFTWLILYIIPLLVVDENSYFVEFGYIVNIERFCQERLTKRKAQ
jgi:hypothetical protein